jgi:polyisoprenoid-binding protein YceI
MAGLALSLLLVDVGAAAQGRPANGAAARVAPTPPSKDPATAEAGRYKLDPDHASVIVRVLHEGTSFSTARFNGVSGMLDWDPQVEKSKVDVTVDSKSIATPAAGFADRLTGEGWLNAAKFPQAKFVSTSVRRTGPTTGEINGNLTFLGQTRPLVVAAEVVGISKNIHGVMTMGFKGSAKFKRSDYGLMTLLPAIAGDEVELVLDLSFNREA